jgi:hypothetical protein
MVSKALPPAGIHLGPDWWIAVGVYEGSELKERVLGSTQQLLSSFLAASPATSQ